MTKPLYLVFFATALCTAVENGRNAVIVTANDENHARQIANSVSDSDILPWMFAEVIKLGEAEKASLPIKVGNPKPVDAKDYREGEIPASLLELIALEPSSSEDPSFL